MPPRGGGQFPTYPWGDDPPTASRANIDRIADATTPVGSYPTGQTPQGLMDMCGNVWEWCRDTWRQDSYRTLAPGAQDPCSLGSGEEKGLRGGSFDSFASQGRCSFRFHAPSHMKNHTIGFRLVFHGT